MTLVPGVGILGGALSLGATLLDPQPSPKDLQKAINECKEELKSISETDEELRVLLEEGIIEDIKELETKIATPMSEIRTDISIIHKEMSEVKKVLQDGSVEVARELSDIKDMVKRTFTIVADVKYKVCLNQEKLPTLFSRGVLIQEGIFLDKSSFLRFVQDTCKNVFMFITHLFNVWIL